MKTAKKLPGVMLLISLLAGLTYVALYPRAVEDWWALRDYVPEQRIVEIADATTLTDDARRVFYIYDPQIQDSTEFNTHCTVQEVSIVLGCYDGSNIYIYNVTEAQLAGVQEVTAAHEVLHAAYDRLSESERNRVDELTERQFQKLANERIVATIKAYRARDPSVVPNELHSILATEVRNLDPELEQYYAQYFKDRSKIVDLSEKYEQVFNDIKSKVERLDAELTLLKAQIDSLEADLSIRANRITIEKNQLDRLYDQKLVSEYNDRVPDYNYSVDLYNQDLARYRSLIEEYNVIVATRNESTVEQNSLIDSLSSKAVEL